MANPSPPTKPRAIRRSAGACGKRACDWGELSSRGTRSAAFQLEWAAKRADLEGKCGTIRRATSWSDPDRGPGDRQWVDRRPVVAAEAARWAGCLAVSHG